MSDEQARREARRIFDAVEEGKLSTSDALAVVEAADPALVYLTFTWLRKRYADHPNSDSVIGRIVEISGRGSVPKIMKEGQADVVSRWFEETYNYKDLERDAFIELIVEKLEG